MDGPIPEKPGSVGCGGIGAIANQFDSFRRFLVRLVLFGVGVVCLIVLAFVFLASPAKSQTPAEGFADSYITPFPEGDIYKIRFIGNTMAQYLMEAFVDTLGGDPRMAIDRQRWILSRVMRADFDEALAALKRDVSASNTNVAVVMFGHQDRRSIRVDGNKKWPGSDEWRAVFSKRIDAVMKALKQENIAVYWIGQPIMRKSNANDDAQVMNDVIRERAYINGLKYIDAFTIFADETGQYNSYGPDLGGKMRLLREQDGVHLTYAGNQKLVHYIERVLLRDIKAARAERSVPLAGDASEQQQIRRASGGDRQFAGTGDARTGGAWQTRVSEGGDTSANVGAAPNAGGLFARHGGDQPQDNSRLDIEVHGTDGGKRTVTLEIIRPALSSSIVSLITRKASSDKPADLGTRLIGQIAGGATVISTVTPASAVTNVQRKLSPTQTPFFRVLVKGERLVPKTGRADDVTWSPPNAGRPAANAVTTPQPRG